MAKLRFCVEGWVEVDTDDITFMGSDLEDVEKATIQKLPDTDIVSKLEIGALFISLYECISACTDSELRTRDYEID